MKNLYLLLIMTAFVSSSCTTDSDNNDFEIITATEFEVAGKALPAAGTVTSGTSAEICSVTRLIAGQNQVAGKVYILSDNNNLYITYATAAGWIIDETHMFIGERSNIPANGSGNPRVGHFPYAAYHNTGTNEVTYTIPLNAVPDCFTLAAHAVVSAVDNNGTRTTTETAWTEGSPIGGANWAMATDYCTTGCASSADNGPTRIR